MATIGTILVLDANSTVSAHKVFDSTDHIVIPVRSAPKARHMLERGIPDVWICDLTLAELPLTELLDIAAACIPGIQTLLTGPPLSRPRAERLISQGYAHGFIPKPWQMAALRREVREALHRCDLPARPLTQKPVVPRTLPTPSPAPAEGRYRIQELIGEGGTGRVYRAEDLLLDMPVAVKVVHPALADDVGALNSLKAEARIAMQLSHTHIVRLFNFARLNGRYLLVMEYVRGQTLQELLDAAEKLSIRTVMQLAKVCGTALDYAHRHGVLHNDLKPANILLSDDGVLKIIDFGIACLVGRTNTPGWLVGTPEYMSPEQLRGTPLNAQTDVYAVGVILYQLLTGDLPFPPGRSPSEGVDATPTVLTGLPDPILEVLAKATHVDQEKRWPDIVSFINRFLDVCHEHLRELDHATGVPA